MFWKSVISNVGIKFEANFASTGEILKPNTLINQWEEMTFDFSSKIGEPSSTNINGIVVFPDFDQNRSQDNIVYFDNITFSEQVVDPTLVPLEPAPTPTLAQSQVINMFSNAYTQDVNVSSWRSDWSTSTLTDIQIQGNDTKRYIGADFVGVEFYAPNAVDATAMNYFHLDVWSPNATVFRVKLVDLGSGTVEGEIAFNIPQSQWVKLDIPLVDFADPTKVTNPAFLLTSRNSLQQLIFSGQPVGGLDFYIDNVYFATDASLSINEFATANFSVYPNPSQTEWTVNAANDIIKSIQLVDVLGKQVLSITPNTSVAKIDASQLNNGLYFANIVSENGSSTIKLIKN